MAALNSQGNSTSANIDGLQQFQPSLVCLQQRDMSNDVLWNNGLFWKHFICGGSTSMVCYPRLPMEKLCLQYLNVPRLCTHSGNTLKTRLPLICPGSYSLLRLPGHKLAFVVACLAVWEICEHHICPLQSPTNIQQPTLRSKEPPDESLPVSLV